MAFNLAHEWNDWGSAVNSVELLPLVDKIYDTALAPEKWGDVLYDVSALMGARGAIIFEVLEGTERLIAPYQSENYDPVDIKNYLAKFGDFEFQNQIEFAKMVSDSNSIELINDLDVEAKVDDERMRIARKELDTLYNMGHRTGTILNKDSWNIDRLALQYDLSRGPATDQEKELGKMVFPHIAKALRIGRPLMGVYGNTEGQFKEKFDRLDFGVALISDLGEPLFSNHEFDRILDQNQAIRFSPSRKLEIKEPSHNERFRHLLQSIEVHGSSGARPRSQALTVIGNCEDAQVELFIELSPASYHSNFGRLPMGTKLLTCLDATRAFDIDTAIVDQFFSLSKSERAILPLIASGHSNLEIAEMRSRSIETVNSQTKTLLRKTHTRNRTELVQLALALKSPFSMAWI